MHRHPHQRPPHERRRPCVWAASGDFVSADCASEQPAVDARERSAKAAVVGVKYGGGFRHDHRSTSKAARLDPRRMLG